MSTARIQTHDVKTAAALLGVSRQTIWRAVKRKELRATRIGRRVVFRETEIIAYLDRRTR